MFEHEEIKAVPSTVGLRRNGPGYQEQQQLAAQHTSKMGSESEEVVQATFVVGSPASSTSSILAAELGPYAVSFSPQEQRQLAAQCSLGAGSRQEEVMTQLMSRESSSPSSYSKSISCSSHSDNPISSTEAREEAGEEGWSPHSSDRSLGAAFWEREYNSVTLLLGKLRRRQNYCLSMLLEALRLEEETAVEQARSGAPSPLSSYNDPGCRPTQPEHTILSMLRQTSSPCFFGTPPVIPIPSPPESQTAEIPQMSLGEPASPSGGRD